jgi:hypothetical protein
LKADVPDALTPTPPAPPQGGAPSPLGGGAAVLPVASATGRLSGLLYGDYYQVAAHHDGRLEGLDGVWIRRIFLTYDKDLKDSLAWRLRFEASSDDFSKTITANTVPWVKDAWVRWDYADGQKAYLGLMESPAFGWLDKQWGLRSVEKTPLDLQGWIPTREQGLGAEGKLGATEYFLTLGNGSGEGSEANDNGKRTSLRLNRDFGKASAMIYGDLASSSTGIFAPEPYGYTLQAFLGCKGDLGRLGATYGRQVQVLPATNDEKVKELLSAYAVLGLRPSLQGFARVDHLLWGTVEKAGIKYLDLAPQRGTLGIVGLDWKATADLALQPNVEFCYYQNDSGGPVASQDVIPRMTFYVQF